MKGKKLEKHEKKVMNGHIVLIKLSESRNAGV
jgi:hypothetical protein